MVFVHGEKTVRVMKPRKNAFNNGDDGGCREHRPIALSDNVVNEYLRV